MAYVQLKGLSKKTKKRYEQMYDTYVTSMAVLIKQNKTRRSRVAPVQRNDPLKGRKHAPKRNTKGDKDNNDVEMSSRNLKHRLENPMSTWKEKPDTKNEISEKMGTRSTDKINSFQKTNDKPKSDRKCSGEEPTKMSNLKLAIVENKLQEKLLDEKSKAGPVNDNGFEERSTLLKEEDCWHEESIDKTIKGNDSLQAIRIRGKKSGIELIDESKYDKNEPESEIFKSLEQKDNKEKYFGNSQSEENSSFLESETEPSELRDISMKTEIPNNSLARLMYYLDCVCIVLMYENSEIKRLRDYRNYVLTEIQIDRLVSLCYHLSPDVLLNKVIFFFKKKHSG